LPSEFRGEGGLNTPTPPRYATGHTQTVKSSKKTTCQLLGKDHTEFIFSRPKIFRHTL